MEDLVPINGCLLVELTDNYQIIATPDKQFSTKTSGVVRGVGDNPTDSVDWEYLLGKTVYFDEFKDGTQVKRDDKEYAFIKFEDIRGHSV